MSAVDIFDIKQKDGAWVSYRARLQVRDKLIGGVPKDPATIKGWLSARLELDDRQLVELTEQVAAEMKGDERPSVDAILDEVTKSFAAGNGFKRIDGQLVYEGRCLKAAIKEAANVAFPGTDFPGKPAGIRKGLMRMLAERVFVLDQYIPLGMSEPSGTEERVKHVQTPQGPRSAINVVDYIDKPTIEATIQVLDDCIKPQVWGRIWQIAEEIGIGADRARSDGKFDLIEWEQLG